LKLVGSGVPSCALFDVRHTGTWAGPDGINAKTSGCKTILCRVAQRQRESIARQRKLRR